MAFVTVSLQLLLKSPLIRTAHRSICCIYGRGFHIDQGEHSGVKKQGKIRWTHRHEMHQHLTFCPWHNQTSRYHQSADMSAKCELVTLENVRQFLDTVDTVLTDCDGVLWNGTDTIPGAPETIQMFRKMGKRVFYVTNNSTKSRDEYKEKCIKMGFGAEKEDIIGSAYVTAKYIKEVLKYDGKVYVIGSSGLQQEFDLLGIKHTGIGKDDMEVSDMNAVANMTLDPEIKCVVVGFDRYFNYAKLTKASSYIQQEGTHFLATNTDSGLPMGERVMPGTGAIVQCVEVAAQKKGIVMGKPQKPIFDVAMQLHNLDPAKTVMIGDRLDTDIELGHNCKFRSLMVQTGFSSIEQARANMASQDEVRRRQVPHYYTPSLQELGKLIKQSYPELS